MMLSQVAAVEITVTRSEAEALDPREQSHQVARAALQYPVPRRQVLSLPDGERRGIPRVSAFTAGDGQGTPLLRSVPHAGAVRESIQLLQRVVSLRTCEDSVFQNRSRPCLLYQIRRCTAPCVGHIAADAYAEDVNSAQLYLEGRSDTA